MSVGIFRGAAAIVLVTTLVTQAARAQSPYQPYGRITAAAPNYAAYTGQRVAPAAATMTPPVLGAGVAPGLGAAPGVGPAGVSALPQYPRLDAPLYPSPVQTTPPWTGGTIITNQALAPHEMLYPHKYHAMYPPFYYKVKGGWVWTPFGIRQHEKWKLQGTEVKVNYRSSYRPFSGFVPPVIH